MKGPESHKKFTKFRSTPLVKCRRLAIAVNYRMKSEDTVETSPVKSVVEELDTLQAAFHGTLQSYSARIDSEIASIRDTIRTQEGRDKISSARLRDLRDMLTLLRNSSFKTDKGRRKDLRKIDNILEDLSMLTENW